MRPEMLANINEAKNNAYEAPDVFNPNLHPPAGAIDVLSIVEAGVDFKSVLAPDYTTEYYKKPTFANPPKVPVGKGICLQTKVGDAYCDGSVDSFCRRGGDNQCLLSGHNDGRHGLMFDSYSGWMVLNLPDVMNGFIAVKYESWHFAEDSCKTGGWQSINNEGRQLSSAEETILNSSNSTEAALTMQHSNTTERRGLKKQQIPFCPEFRFEYAVDGRITSLNLTEWQAASKNIQRVVEVVKLLDDPNYTGGKEVEVEVAVRITGCARSKVFQLTHIYWS
jgi:hypothetical protein